MTKQYKTKIPSGDLWEQSSPDSKTAVILIVIQDITEKNKNVQWDKRFPFVNAFQAGCQIQSKGCRAFHIKQ